jgi:two-component system OmpR family response regulator
MSPQAVALLAGVGAVICAIIRSRCRWASPKSASELLARLRALIRRSVGQAVSRWEIRDLEFDARARTVRKAGVPVFLTPREYAIAEYLILHRGEVVSRTQLYEHLWDENDDTLSNLVDVHIFSIRKKLGSDLITTRRGQGYCIE